MNFIKRRLAGSQIAVRIREIYELTSAAIHSPERAGMLAQDVIAFRLLTRLARPESTFVDVGSHIGSVIAAVNTFDRSIKIIGIEAEPKKAEWLSRRFSYASIHSCAVSEAEGTAVFYIDPKRPAFNSLANRGAKSISISVPVHTLDSLVSEISNVDMVKLDVEGAELGALKGMTRLTDQCRPTIIFESALNDGIKLGYTDENLFRWFSDRDY
ncbi:MAG: FkbM family methyltransferase [Gammaproteobacteria bacterium]|nr:FkbM family methyltransferase [Gammaproteobacteria bacterium]